MAKNIIIPFLFMILPPYLEIADPPGPLDQESSWLIPSEMDWTQCRNDRDNGDAAGHALAC
jgi:hypothetical protein